MTAIRPVVLTAITTAAALPLLSGGAAGATGPQCPTGTLSAAALSALPHGCDTTGFVVQTAIGTLVVPAKGAGVGADAVLVGGRTVSVRLEHRRDGRVVLLGDAQTPGAAAADTGCRDSAYATDRHHFTRQYAWYFNSGGVTNAAAKKAATVRGLTNITKRRTTCGTTAPLPTTVQATFKGVTAKKPAATQAGGCSSPDGTSVVGFGALSNYWGYSCWWWAAGYVTTEADVLLRKDLNWWTSTSIAGCVGRPDLEGLATHEFGHVYGLLHVDESTHRDQTMSTYINSACSTLERTLGKGDLAGLKALYS